jgi:BMFP domain-containing protein YqiC
MISAEHDERIRRGQAPAAAAQRRPSLFERRKVAAARYTAPSPHRKFKVLENVERRHGRHFPCILTPGTLPEIMSSAACGGMEMETRKMSTGANRILDDLARLMTDAAGAAQGVRREVEAAFRAQTENWLNSLDVVKREEFEAVKEMAARARDENDALLARIEALEARLAATGPAAGDITTGK